MNVSVFVLRKSISLLSVSVNNSITLLQTLTTSFDCYSISPLDDDLLLVNTYGHERPVHTIDVHGKEGHIQHKTLPDKIYEKRKGACAYIPSTKTIVFSDRTQDTLYMCDTTSGEGRVIKSDNIANARCICAGPNGSTFVCSVDTNSIVQLSPSGDLLISHDVGIRRPRAVSVSKDGTRMAVSNGLSRQKVLKLFRLEC